MRGTILPLSGMLLLAVPAAQAQFLYSTNADGMTVTITGYSGTGGTAAIPSSTNGLAVTEIGNWAFQACSTLKTVTIPASVTNIGSGVFNDCAGLTGITVDPLNSSYSSVNGALYDKNKTTLIQFPNSMGGSYTIANGVTGIGAWAFEGARFLFSVTIPPGVTNIGTAAFSDCFDLSTVTIGSSVTSIGDSAFYGCSDLSSITIPAGVTSLGNWAFQASSLKNVTIPGTVTNIGYGVFAECQSLSAITVSATNPAYSSVSGVLFDKSQDTLLEYPNGAGTSYSIPGTVTNIGVSAFWDCTSLRSVTLPSAVASIGSNAFYLCESLKSVTIPSGVTNIGDQAFAACIALTGITVSAPGLFYSSLNGVLFDASQTTLIQYPAGLSGNYTISNGVTSLGDYAFFDCHSLSTVTIPGSVTNIGTNAFYLCSGLTMITVAATNAFYSSPNGWLFDESQTRLIHYPGGNIGGCTIPNGVTSIDGGAFDGLLNYPIANLTSVTIPGSVTSIAENTFLCLTGLTNVTIANGVTSIGEGAFFGCTHLASVTIPGSITSIGEEAFVGCPRLTSITIPSSVTSIGPQAFYECAALTSVYFTGNAPGADATVFLDSNTTIYYLPGAMGWDVPVAGLMAVLWNPLIETGDGNFGVVNNQFGFDITGTASIPIVVEASTNLINPVWTPLQSLTLTNGLFYFSDTMPAAADRFYRIGSQ